MGQYLTKQITNDPQFDVKMTNSQEYKYILINRDDILLIRKSSHDLMKSTSSGSFGQESTIPKANSQGNDKKIDKEHITIEKIFRISLQEHDKFMYLEFYLAQIMSMGKEIAFRIKDLDDILISIINSPERVSHIIITYE